MTIQTSDSHTDEPSAGAARPKPILEVEGVGVRFGRLEVLRDMSFRVDAGETVAVIGESGCGKTVLLKVLIGLLRPTTGYAKFDGLDLATLSEKQLARQRIRFGFLFQGAALFDSLSVFENVAFPLREHTSQSRREIAGVVRRRLGEVGLPANIQRKMPAELSGGMKKRVGLARALAMNPEVLLYDEPTTGLDPIMSDVINDLILHTRARNPVTSIVVTHDMRTTRKVADRVLMLYPLSQLGPTDRQIIFEGTPDQVDRAEDARVGQFVRGEAGDRLEQLAHNNQPAP